MSEYYDEAVQKHEKRLLYRKIKGEDKVKHFKQYLAGLMVAALLCLCACSVTTEQQEPPEIKQTPAQIEQPTAAPTEEPAETETGADGAAYQAGTYTAVALGNNGDVEVAVTFSEDAILKVEVTKEVETVGIGTAAIEKIPAAITDGQTLNVNAISGATNTSNAILEAVADCVRQAGGDPEALKKNDVGSEAEAVQKTLSADVVVVGGGASGLAAGVEALQKGLTVAVVEKKDYLGGMASGIEGMFGYGSRMQEEANVELPPLPSLINEEMVYTNYRSDAVVWRNLFSTSGETINWLQDLGIQFDRVDTYQGASLFQCFHWFPNKGGVSYVETLSKYLEDNGAQLLLGTTATELVTDQSGAVTGVKASNSFSNEEYLVNAGSVILCTGGLAGNMELMQELTGHDTSHAMNQSMSVGDGYKMAAAVGAGATDVCALQWPYVYGYDVMDDRQNDLFLAAGYQCLPIINQDGVRFFAEDIYVQYFTALFMNAVSSQEENYVLIDQNTLERYESGEGVLNGFWILCSAGDHLPYLRSLLEEATTDGNGQVLKGETLDDLSAAIGCDPASLQDTVQRYNRFAESGVDEDFGKDAAYLYEIGEGPYYAVKLSRCYVTSVGGINIDAGNRVLDANDKPIAGLYSAGVDSCELYKETYNYQLSGGMMAYNVYSGRNAVRSIVYDHR